MTRSLESSSAGFTRDRWQDPFPDWGALRWGQREGTRRCVSETSIIGFDLCLYSGLSRRKVKRESKDNGRWHHYDGGNKGDEDGLNRIYGHHGLLDILGGFQEHAADDTDTKHDGEDMRDALRP